MKKKYRWSLEGTFPNSLGPIFVKIYSDPEVENYFTVCIHEIDTVKFNEISNLVQTGEFKLTKYDGIGNIVEEHILKEASIEKIDFYDYSEDPGTDYFDVVMKIKYRSLHINIHKEEFSDKIRPFLQNLNRSEGLLKFHDDHIDLIMSAKGSSYNHQTWIGGYHDHLVHCFVLGQNLYKFFKDNNVSLEFSFESVVVVVYFHDIEKIFKYNNKTPEPTEVLLERYHIVLDDQEKNALKYAHGEGSDYSKEKRVSSQLAGFLHSIDNLSARVLYDTKELNS
jgi:hypothetical protein